VILHAADRRRIRRVVACSPEVSRLGVRAGMAITEADALLRRGASAGSSGGSGSKPRSKNPRGDRFACRYDPADPESDRLELLRMAERCEAFSPQIGCATVAARARDGSGPIEFTEFTLTDGLLCEIGGVSRWMGGDSALLREVERVLGAESYQARWGIAPTLGAAWALARYGDDAPECSGSKYKYSGSELGERELWDRVRRMPVSALRLTPAIEESLKALGLLWIEQLAAVPRDALAVRFGGLPGLRLDQLLGDRDELLIAHQRKSRPTGEQCLEYPTASRPIIEGWVRRLLERIAPTLESAGLGALEIICRFECAEREPLWLRIGLFEPTGRIEHWMELVRMQFEQAVLPGAVHRVGIEITRTAKMGQRQASLPRGAGGFSEGFGDDPDRDREMAELMDRLSGRLGRDAVWWPQPVRDAQPELAYETVLVAASASASAASGDSRGGTRRRESGLAAHCRGPLQRPLVLHTPPKPLEVLAKSVEGPPRRCAAGTRPFEIVRWWGPERIETGWWRGVSVRRDYYRVETGTGHRFWIFRRLPHEHWFLHGAFE